MVQFLAYDGHFIDTHDGCRLALKELQVKSFLPYVVSKGEQHLWVSIRNRLFCLNFEMAEWQRNHVVAWLSYQSP